MMSLGDIAAVLDVPYLQSALLLTLIIILALWKRHQSKAANEDVPVNGAFSIHYTELSSPSEYADNVTSPMAVSGAFARFEL